MRSSSRLWRAWIFQGSLSLGAWQLLHRLGVVVIVRWVFILWAKNFVWWRLVILAGVQRARHDLGTISCLLNALCKWSTSSANLVFIHWEVLFGECLCSTLFTWFWFYQLLDATRERPLRGSFWLCFNQLLGTGLWLKLWDTVWSQVVGLRHRVLVAKLTVLDRVVDGVRRLHLMIAKSQRAAYSFTSHPCAWTPLTVNLSLGSHMQVLTLYLATWDPLNSIAGHLARIINNFTVLHFLHGLLVWEASRVYLVNAIDSFRTSWCTYNLAIVFFSAFVSQNILIHEEVYASTELINRILLLKPSIFSKSCQDILLFWPASTIVWMGTTINKTL